MAVTDEIDYEPGASMPVVGVAFSGDEPQILPSADVLEFRLEGDNKLLVRPSGTEPKIKAYLFAKGADAASANTFSSISTLPPGSCWG